MAAGAAFFAVGFTSVALALFTRGFRKALDCTDGGRDGTALAVARVARAAAAAGAVVWDDDLVARVDARVAGAVGFDLLVMTVDGEVDVAVK